jgi:hypothetical protein
MENVMGNVFVANCKRCGQPVREGHPYVMVVPVGRGRMVFHAGCWRIKAMGDPDGDRLTAEHEESSA